MIRYDYAPEQIEAAVNALDGQWRVRAAERTKAIVKKKRFDESSSIWSDVKPVFIALQNRKCIFCERQFESAEYGRIEHDLEHFRPKSAVKPWPPRNWATTYTISTGAESPAGYYWLAYDLGNYAAACKVCNSPLKADHFPIADKRVTTKRTIARLQEEMPYLCYPIGRYDDPPESLVTFIATTAVPAARSGHRKLRGEVIIDFFQLNVREQLHRERARLIALLGGTLKFIDAGIDVAQNQRVAAGLVEPHIPHTSCLRAYRKLWDDDNQLARRAHSRCQEYAISMEGAKPPAGVTERDESA
ncbi:MAG TPA: hypothetical protein VK148_26055 [Xanthobacteraceae bacterium]|nr:hypothetical protein [Xanthobacteraceae bacterium]